MENGSIEYLTKEKYKELTEELNFLATTKRKEVAEQLESAKALGDLSENAEYHEAREQQALIEDRIRKVEYVLKHAKIVEHKEGDVVEMGSTVIVKKEGDKDNKEFTLVGSEEADTIHGRISNVSPMGQALMDKKKGEEFIFQTPNGTKIKYRVISVK
jgi:transcription elongation factor GreA